MQETATVSPRLVWRSVTVSPRLLGEILQKEFACETEFWRLLWSIVSKHAMKPSIDEVAKTKHPCSPEWTFVYHAFFVL